MLTGSILVDLVYCNEFRGTISAASECIAQLMQDFFLDIDAKLTLTVVISFVVRTETLSERKSQNQYH